MRIFLEFSPERRDVERKRLQYAFALFCAVRGHQIAKRCDASAADVRITYSAATAAASPHPALRLANLYRARPLTQPAPAPKAFRRGPLTTVLFYEPAASQEPDWLAEIFEWVSCSDEYSIERRDSIGRIDFRDSYVGRYNLDLTVPYAGLAMQFLDHALHRCLGLMVDEGSRESGGHAHFVINTHDVDILPHGYFGSLYRLAKYALISLLKFNSPRTALRQAGQTLAMAIGGPNVLDQTPRVMNGEISAGVGASYFFIARHNHRRDGNYRVADIAVTQLMHAIEASGMEVALHGSYTSLDRPPGLAYELSLLQQANVRPRGNRQHWLRFTLDRLIPAVEQSGVLYDSSLGWDRLGFRAGACFAFPPYNFEREGPATFLEIPLVVMEIGLVTEDYREERWVDHVKQVLTNSRECGRGGISLLWHPTAFGGGQLPPEIERIFWELIERRHECNDTWVSAIDFVRMASSRYIEAGLLPSAYASDLRRTPQEVSAPALCDAQIFSHPVELPICGN